MKKEFTQDSLEKLQQIHETYHSVKKNTFGKYQLFADCIDDLDRLREGMQNLLLTFSAALYQLEYDTCEGMIDHAADFLYTMMQTADSCRFQSGLLMSSVEKATRALETAVKNFSNAAEEDEST